MQQPQQSVPLTIQGGGVQITPNTGVQPVNNNPVGHPTLAQPGAPSPVSDHQRAPAYNNLTRPQPGGIRQDNLVDLVDPGMNKNLTEFENYANYVENMINTNQTIPSPLNTIISQVKGGLPGIQIDVLSPQEPEVVGQVALGLSYAGESVRVPKQGYFIVG